jgi:hypothetical protein
MRRALVAAVVAMAVAALPQVAAGLLVWTFVVVPLTTAGQGTVFDDRHQRCRAGRPGLSGVTLPSSFASGWSRDPVASTATGWRRSGTTVGSLPQRWWPAEHGESVTFQIPRLPRPQGDVVAQPRSSPAGLQRLTRSACRFRWSCCRRCWPPPTPRPTPIPRPRPTACGPASPSHALRCHRCPAWGVPPPLPPSSAADSPRPRRRRQRHPQPTATPTRRGWRARGGPGASGGQLWAPGRPGPGDIGIGTGSSTSGRHRHMVGAAFVVGVPACWSSCGWRCRQLGRWRVFRPCGGYAATGASRRTRSLADRRLRSQASRRLRTQRERTLRRERGGRTSRSCSSGG